MKIRDLPTPSLIADDERVTENMNCMSRILSGRAILGPILAGLVGLIPNCGSSVVITKLYLEGALGFGAMLAGLLVNAGVGLLVLFKVNHDRKENLTILGMLYVIGVASGIIASLIAG